MRKLIRKLRYALFAGIPGSVPTTSVNDQLKNNQIDGAGALQIIVENILNLLLFVAWPIGFAAILYSAYLLINSGGSPDAYAKAKKNITYLLIGFTLISLAAVLVYAYKKFLGGITA